MDHEAKRPNGVSAEENGNAKTEVEASSGMCDKINDENPQPAEPPKQDYIHVRARRGQATDNHSLAERVSMFDVVFSNLKPFNLILGHLLIHWRFTITVANF